MNLGGASGKNPNTIAPKIIEITNVLLRSTYAVRFLTNANTAVAINPIHIPTA